MNWDYLQEHWDWAGHIVEALGIAGVVFLIARFLFSARIAWVFALAFAAGHFHGREKRDYEISAHLTPPHLDGHYFWRWGWDGSTDFWPVALVCIALAVFAIRWRSKEVP